MAWPPPAGVPPDVLAVAGDDEGELAFAAPVFALGCVCVAAPGGARLGAGMAWGYFHNSPALALDAPREEVPVRTGGPEPKLSIDSPVFEFGRVERDSKISHVFKVTSDPYLGKLAMLRILQGRLDNQTSFVLAAEKKPHKKPRVRRPKDEPHA